jgi:hypothetical protein
MRLYLVRRTRSFIQDNYAETDPATGRKYLVFETGDRFYFPIRRPRTVKFSIEDKDRSDPYARLHADLVVSSINGLNLPRYGMANFVAATPHEPPSAAEESTRWLVPGWQRLMGLPHKLFKRLESGGPGFLQSLERHVLRNFIFIYAIENRLELPLGTQGAELLDAAIGDDDPEIGSLRLVTEEDGDEELGAGPIKRVGRLTEAEYRQQAAEVYERYATRHRRRFKWLRSGLFVDDLAKDLVADAR